MHKKDVRSASAMLEHNSQYAVILAFDVKIEREAQLLADELGIRIFSANIIYHLYDSFTKYLDDLKEKKREENKHVRFRTRREMIKAFFTYTVQVEFIFSWPFFPAS